MSRSEQREKLVELATQIWMAFRLALPSQPQNTQAVLERRAVDSDMRWVLSLVLAAALAINRSQQSEATALQAVHGLDAANIRIVLAEMGAGLVVAQADPLVQKMPALPRALATGSIDKAAAVLIDAIRVLPDQGRALNDWLRSAEMIDAAWALVNRFPEPQSGLAPRWSEAPDSPPPSQRSTRGERFDRADFGQRSKRSYSKV
jgi:hypothetical protein